MIKRRIHTLKASIIYAQDPYQDQDGNMIFPEQTKVDIEESCRGESNTIDGRKPVTDGYVLDYSYLVFTSKDIELLPNGTDVKILVEGSSEVFGEGKVVKFERGQRVTRIWLK